jgi:hypothetical protein
MKIYAVAAHDRTKKPPGYRSTWAYQELFHGISDPRISNRYGEKPYRKCRLIKNISILPKVFFADISMAVNAEVAMRLKFFSGVDLAPYEWEAVFKYPLDEAHITELLERFSVLTEDFAEWQKTLYRKPKPGEIKEDYYQVLAPRFASVVGEFMPNDSIELPGAVYESFRPLRTSQALHEKYPMVKALPYYLCSQAVFDTIAPDVSDPASFKIYEVEVRA